MSEISEFLKQRFQDRINGELESYSPESWGGKKIYWKPLTGRQQKAIQAMAEKSTAEGICMHVKTRAIDENGEQIFKEPIVGMMNDFDFEKDISPIFFAMTGVELTADEIAGN